MNKMIPAIAMTVCLGTTLGGCTDLKPLETDVASLKSQLTRMQSDIESVRESTQQNESAAKSAAQIATAAQHSADQALAASESAQASYKTLDEKIERAFRHSLSK